MPRLLRLAAFVVPLVLCSTRAQAAPIDFEAFIDGDFLTNQITGLTFSNAQVLTAGIGLNEFETPPASGFNVAANTFDLSDTPLEMQIDFSIPMVLFSGLFSYGSQLSISAFDSLGVLLGTTTSAFVSNLALSGDLGSSPNELLTLAFADMAFVKISGGSFTMDDLNVSQVPEPSTLLLMGVGGLVMMIRRRRGNHEPVVSS